jgi:hypothetical protein
MRATWMGPASVDWSTVATLATAAGTLVLAIATFAAVRSANRAARVAEAAYQVHLRPLLVPSRLEDPPQKVRWMDNHWVRLEGGQATAEVIDGSIYLAISIRNVGSGMAVPFGWVGRDGASTSEVLHAESEDFRLQMRDLFVAPSDTGFWQAAIRDHDDGDYLWVSRAIAASTPFTIELLYGDYDGGQRTITRFAMIPWPVDEQVRWYPTVSRHWNLDRPDPR